MGGCFSVQFVITVREGYTPPSGSLDIAEKFMKLTTNKSILTQPYLVVTYITNVTICETCGIAFKYAVFITSINKPCTCMCIVSARTEGAVRKIIQLR